MWDEHKRFITAAAIVFLGQAITIAALLAQRARRRRAEAEILRQRTELAHVARVSTMGQLASALAHEINQPLGAILRNAEAAELFLQGEKPDLQELRAILSDIRKDDQRAGGVIDRMRSLLKRRSLDSTVLDMRDLLEETVALASPDAQARRVQLVLQTPGRLPAIRGDRVHLQQVLLNLILNGMDAMSGGANGERLVLVKGTEAKDGGVEVRVSDRGTGIPPDKVTRIFEPFFTTKPNGMGMGLAISRTIIEAHGGTIRAENNSENGATFLFTLPGNRSQS
jgi:C4-dicarboxylate-specific signal transduction histidine kinase